MKRASVIFGWLGNLAFSCGLAWAALGLMIGSIASIGAGLGLVVLSIGLWIAGEALHRRHLRRLMQRNGWRTPKP